MPIIEVKGLTYGYGRVDALRGVDLGVPAGALCALLGPNGAGKTTLLQILAGLRRPRHGSARVMGVECEALGPRERERIGFVGDAQRMPDWMRLDELERFLTPLYPSWDADLALRLRERFNVPSDRPIRALSRGERMKAALLCALAPRPAVLFMDEPFSGIDVLVRDDLVRGLLESAGSDGWTVVISSHEIAEVEMLADYVVILTEGRVRLDASMDEMRSRFLRVEVNASRAASAATEPDARWMSVEHADRRLAFTADAADERRLRAELAARFPDAMIEVRPATLREVFVALSRADGRPSAAPRATLAEAAS